MWVHRHTGLFAPEECDRMVDAQGDLPTEVAQTNTGVSRIRRGTVAWRARGAGTEWMFERVERFAVRCAAQAGFAHGVMLDQLQFSIYPVGGCFDWHVDAGPGCGLVPKVTVVVQLSRSASYEGGQFDVVGQRPSVFHRAQGSAVAFPTFLAHRVQPVTAGVRRTLVAWLSGPQWR